MKLEKFRRFEVGGIYVHDDADANRQSEHFSCIAIGEKYVILRSPRHEIITEHPYDRDVCWRKIYAPVKRWAVINEGMLFPTKGIAENVAAIERKHGDFLVVELEIEE